MRTPDLETLDFLFYETEAQRQANLSRDFLAWFLESYFRLDRPDIQDAICDGSHDMGIDGIHVDNQGEVVYLLQSKTSQGRKRGVSNDVKHFIGSLAQFETREQVERVYKDTKNRELRGALESQEVAQRVGDGYAVRGVFVTNLPMDQAAQDLCVHRPDIVVYDRDRLEREWVAPGYQSAMRGPVTFNLGEHGIIQYQADAVEVFVASLLGKELVTLNGIENQAIFDHNVRKPLPSNKVNKEIKNSIQDATEHDHFMLYHNGITILAESVHYNEALQQLTINGYSVVNGAQSLSLMYSERGNLTKNLRVLGRVVKIAPESELATKITTNTNNQNVVKSRDLASNKPIQKRLQEDFQRLFGSRVGYMVKRGNKLDTVQVISNEDAARMILAFDLQIPWRCHQPAKYFAELHGKIFGNRNVTPERIVALIAAGDGVKESLTKLSNQRMANYTVTVPFFLYMVRLALSNEDIGCPDTVSLRFCQDPGEIIRRSGLSGLDAATDAIKHCVRVVAEDLVQDINAEMDENHPEGLDYKRVLRNSKDAADLARAALTSYTKAVRRGRASTFSEEWANLGLG